MIPVQNPPTGSHTCPDPTPANGTIVTGLQNILPNGTFPVGNAIVIRCDEGFTMNEDLGNFPGLVIICEEQGVWSQPPPECIPNEDCEYKLQSLWYDQNVPDVFRFSVTNTQYIFTTLCLNLE